MVTDYQLYCGKAFVGKLVNVDTDELSGSGRLVFDLQASAEPTPETFHIQKFVSLSETLFKLSEAADDPIDEQKLHQLTSQLAEYRDLEESPNWHVVDSAGSRQPILCPLFKPGGEISWRWSDA